MKSSSRIMSILSCGVSGRRVSGVRGYQVQTAAATLVPISHTISARLVSENSTVFNVVLMEPGGKRTVLPGLSRVKINQKARLGTTNALPTCGD
jgi:hypothetical protein